MLERVALNQTRFHAPGLAPDGRGVALGPKLALLFASLDRLVGFFRIYSEQASLDDVLPSLHIHRVRTPVAAHELLVVLAVDSSYAADRAARVARLLGGLCFTGAGKHFVQYRDESSPLGYDVAEVTQQSGDFVLYGDAFTQAYARAEEVSFAQLLFRLQLIQVPGPPEVGDAEFLYVAARRGLGQALLRYLWRNRVACEAAFCDPPEGSAFREQNALWIVRVRGLPARMLRLFVRTPGLSVYRPVGANVAIEVGYRHPIALESCAQVFAAGKFYLFSGQRDAAEVLAGPLDFVPGDAFVQPTWDLARDRRVLSDARARKPAPLAVPLKLVPSFAPPRRVSAALLPWAQASWLKKLVYALPPTLLRGHRVAATAELLVVVADSSLDVIPLGTPMQELAPGLYVPVGYELAPRTSPEVLAQHAGAGPERLIFFAPFLERPLAVEASALAPLERRTLAEIEIQRAEPAEELVLAEEPSGEPEIVSGKVGRFALWGFKSEKPEPP